MARLARIVAPGLVRVRPVLDRVGRFADLTDGDADPTDFTAIRTAETTGRALGTADFVTDLEQRLDRPIARRAPGRKPAARVKARPGLL